jgi:hypothetical protein
MATRNIARLYDTGAHARAAIGELESAGFGHDNISYMGPERDAGTIGSGSADASGDAALRDDTRRTGTGSDTGAATGATLGTVVGGGAGLLAGLGALAIPGVGPVVAAGWLIATLTGAGAGAAAGGLLGGLAGAGFGEEEAGTYSEGVRRGGHLVVVRAPDSRVTDAERIMDRHHPVDMTRRTADWRDEGWTGTAGAAGTTAGGVSSGTLGGTSSGAYRGGVAAPGLDESLPGANDPLRRRPGDVA